MFRLCRGPWMEGDQGMADSKPPRGLDGAALWVWLVSSVFEVAWSLRAKGVPWRLVSWSAQASTAGRRDSARGAHRFWGVGDAHRHASAGALHADPLRGLSPLAAEDEAGAAFLGDPRCGRGGRLDEPGRSDKPGMAAWPCLPSGITRIMLR
jgi:hypothetical protein